MRKIFAVASTFALVALTSNAQVPTDVMGDDIYVVSSRDNPAFAMAAWEEDGQVQQLAGSEAAEAPNAAVTYSATEVIWPTARVRVLTFDKDNGGVLHPITDETILYVLSGVAKVGVGDKSISLAAGDVVSFPSDALRNAGNAADATVVTWNTPSLTGHTEPTYVPGAGVEEMNRDFLDVKLYRFPGNTVRYATLLAGFSTAPTIANTDAFIYVTSGELNWTKNGKSFVLREGDFIREIAGLENYWNVEKESTFVVSSGRGLAIDTVTPNNVTDNRSTH